MKEGKAHINNGALADIAAMSGVVFGWPGKRGFKIAIDEFTLTRGSRTLLLGPSGSGKSTLLSLLCGVATPQSGRIELMGADLTRMSNAMRDRFRAEHVGVIFQLFNLLPYGSPVDNVILPLSFSVKRRDRARRVHDVRREAERILAALGITGDLLKGTAAELSVGQQQRVAVARALIGSPEIIVADEPSSALDKNSEDRFLDLLCAQVQEATSTLVMVSHDERLAPHFDRVLNLGDILKQADW